jgi:sulfur relay (sulfurtransferase) complex TusBCD TusD component (DsrE family)
MVIFSFVVCAEPYKFEAIDTLLNLGEAVLIKGHKILGIFFYGSGVYNINKDVNVGSAIRNLPKRLEDFMKKHNLNISACSTWVSFTGLKGEKFIPGVCQEGLGGLSEWIAASDRVIMFGPGG